jgi:hypothetical protein
MILSGPAPLISANGTTNPIVWTLQFENGAILRAFNANDLTKEYYDSNQNSARDSAGAGVRANPVVANGRVYVPAATHIVVYGLLP